MDGYGDPIPPGHGEPDTASPFHGSSNVYGDEWQFDPRPVPPSPDQEVEF